jgi:hypothetical protein
VPADPANLDQSVPVEISGVAGITVGPEALFDTAYTPLAEVTLAGPNSSFTPPFVKVNSLTSGNTLTGASSTVDFDETFLLVSGDVYTLTLYANAGYNADPPEDLSAFVDPMAIISPAFEANNPGFELAFAPGFPGNSSSTSTVPEKASTLALLGASAVLLACARAGRRSRPNPRLERAFR